MIDFDEFYKNRIIPIRDWDIFWIKLEKDLQRTAISRPKRQRCGKCVECIKPNCSKCINCLDKLGRNSRKQRCRKIGVCLAWNKC